MDRINIPFSAITPKPEGKDYMFDSLSLGRKNMEDILTFSKVPTTLLNIDDKFHTRTALQVLNALPTTSIDALVVDDKIQILDPKSVYCDDDSFESLLSRFSIEPTIVSSNGFGKTATLDIPTIDTDSFLGDLFQKSIKVDRLPEGGVSLQVGLLRLICTNMCRVKDAQFSHLIRNSVIDDALLQAFQADSHSFDLNAYFQNIFTKDGEFLPISVADYLAMKDTISKLTEPDTADLYFPIDPIVNHYSAQDIDIHKLSRGMLAKLPTGLRYYDAFNFLTNAAKQVQDITLADQIKIADFARPSRLQALKDTDIHYVGVPHFDASIINALKGDTPMTFI